MRFVGLTHWPGVRKLADARRGTANIAAGIPLRQGVTRHRFTPPLTRRVTHMAKETTTSNPVSDYEKLVREIDALGAAISPATRELVLAEARGKAESALLQSFQDDLSKLVHTSRHASLGDVLAGRQLIVAVTYPSVAEQASDDEATATTLLRVRNAPVARGKGGKKPRVSVNGVEYATGAEAARANGIECDGRSATRELKRALEAGTIKSLEFITVEPEEDSPNDDGTLPTASPSDAAASAKENASKAG